MRLCDNLINPNNYLTLWLIAYERITLRSCTKQFKKDIRALCGTVTNAALKKPQFLEQVTHGVRSSL